MKNIKEGLNDINKGYKFLNKNNEEMGVLKNALALVYFNA